jgi:class 3 adenylate cyclase
MPPRRGGRARATAAKDVHEAARIGELGGPGEITASLATANLVDGLSRSEPETVTLKGLAEPVAVVRLDWR